MCNAQDCWFGVEDPVERKRIQYADYRNRLAQRKRRLQKRVPRIPPPTTQAESSTTASNNHVQSPSESQTTATLWSPLATMTTVQLQPPNTSSSMMIEIPNSVCHALYTNGAMMGLTCGITIPTRSKPAGPEIPASLHPTALQCSVEHPTWIDRWPFPKFRDNTILFCTVFDSEAFLRDLFSMESFRLEPGKPGWDPTAWFVAKGFKEKWGFLFE